MYRENLNLPLFLWAWKMITATIWTSVRDFWQTNTNTHVGKYAPVIDRHRLIVMGGMTMIMLKTVHLVPEIALAITEVPARISLQIGMVMFPHHVKCNAVLRNVWRGEAVAARRRENSNSCQSRLKEQQDHPS